MANADAYKSAHIEAQEQGGGDNVTFKAGELDAALDNIVSTLRHDGPLPPLTRSE